MSIEIKTLDVVKTKPFLSTGKNRYSTVDEVPSEWYLFTHYHEQHVGQEAIVTSILPERLLRENGEELDKTVDMGIVLLFDDGLQLHWDPKALEVVNEQ